MNLCLVIAVATTLSACGDDNGSTGDHDAGMMTPDATEGGNDAGMTTDAATPTNQCVGQDTAVNATYNDKTVLQHAGDCVLMCYGMANFNSCMTTCLMD